MKYTSYWLDTSSAGPDRSGTEVGGDVDVAVVGAGLTGVSAALHLARKGAKVAVFERETVAWGASGRNGGMATPGLAIGFRDAIARYGFPTASTLYLTYYDAIDAIEKLVGEEGIDCDFARTGKMNLAVEACPSRWSSQDPRRAGRAAGLRDPDGAQERAAHGARQRRLSRGDDRSERRRAARRQVHPRAGGGRRPDGRADPREGAGAGRQAAGRHQARGSHSARQRPCRPGAGRHQRLHQPPVPVAAAADRAGRQLHHRHRAPRQGRL